MIVTFVEKEKLYDDVSKWMKIDFIAKIKIKSSIMYTENYNLKKSNEFIGI
jgi:hypothetical protein